MFKPEAKKVFVSWGAIEEKGIWFIFFADVGGTGRCDKKT